MRHRLFIALAFPADLNSKIQELSSRIPLKLDWEKPQKLHLTLNFLGNITDEQLPKLQENLTTRLNNHSPFKLHFGFVETMYRRHEGSFLYTSPDQNSQDLLALQETLKDTVYHLDVPVADRFWPHILIARIPKADPVTTKSLLDKIDGLDLKVRFTWPVESVVLFESKSDRSDTHYSRVVTFPLSST